MKLNFFGKNVLITGGNSTLALDLARLLISHAMIPVLSYRSDEALAKIDAFLKEFPDRYGTVYLNMQEPESLDRAFEDLTGPIDYLVDCAQGDYESLVASASLSEVSAYFNENITFRAELLRRVSRLMLAQKRGRLLFVSSTAAQAPNPGQGFYAASKCASEALYRSLGIELAGKGITSLSLRPGYINAGRGSDYIKKAGEQLRQKIPSGKVLSTEEVAQTILFLLSESAAGINAVEITMDGGLTAGK
ncbi:MAG: SDR family oxidoreductase [bacterium]|nr:SDR family oxidoreductase [bacterium]